MLDEKVEYKVCGYRNRWSIIDTVADYVLLENCTYGDETCYLVVKDQEPVMRTYRRPDDTTVELPTIMDVICETYDGREIALEEEGLI
jgi:hypothetical protein